MALAEMSEQRVVAVADARAACGALVRHGPAALVCGVDLGTSSALTLLLAMRRAELRIPTILILPAASRDPVIRALADGWLEEPVRLEDWIRVLRRLVPRALAG